MLLRAGQGDATTQSNTADDLTEHRLTASIISEFGEHKLGGLWMPAMTIRTAELSGGGQRVIAGDDVMLYGTDKFDRINTGRNSYVESGSGDDHVTVRANSIAFGDDGDDTVVGDNGAIVSGGSGNDVAVAAWDSIAFGDEGDDDVMAYYGSEAYGGDGNDTVTAVEGSLADGGAGNDRLVAKGGGNTLTGGIGDDTLDLTKAYSSTISYAAGDGNDTIVLGDYSRRKQSFGEAPKTTLALAASISAQDTRIEISGNQAVLSFAGSADRLTVKFDDNSSLTIAFADGTSRELTWAKRGGFQPAAASTEAKYFEF